MNTEEVLALLRVGLDVACSIAAEEDAVEAGVQSGSPPLADVTHARFRLEREEKLKTEIVDDETGDIGIPFSSGLQMMCMPQRKSG